MVSEDEEHMALGLATTDTSETPTTLHTEDWCWLPSDLQLSSWMALEGLLSHLGFYFPSLKLATATAGEHSPQLFPQCLTMGEGEERGGGTDVLKSQNRQVTVQGSQTPGRVTPL